jgi:hypothetical protein
MARCAQSLGSSGRPADSARARVAGVGIGNFFRGGIRNEVEGGGDKRFVDSLEDRAQTEIERLQKSSRLMHHRPKLFEQRPDYRGDQGRAQSVPHDITDQNSRPGF